ncbi:MAG: phosphonate metabolism protein/1,5-bisphosphokinase (PRPP-forming) PhnN [Rhodospirillaceae bacterium]|nr:phosphonate metabolism protein/1,5-bisphosphokinase (PRPP-forming) PhnN [Rhodospirillaceae bacterium]
MAENDPLGQKPSGTLFLVVGPSGVGKDSLIDGARVALAGEVGFVFPQRTITRAADAGGEDHRAITSDRFAAEAAAGKYALSWQAHGLDYGIPVSIADDLSQGRSVIVNVSRGVLDAARQKFGRVRVLSIRASEQTLAARLADRGRESAEDIEQRIRRAAAYDVIGSDVIEIFNDGSLKDAIERVTAVLRDPG